MNVEILGNLVDVFIFPRAGRFSSQNNSKFKGYFANELSARLTFDQILLPPFYLVPSHAPFYYPT